MDEKGCGQFKHSSGSPTVKIPIATTDVSLPTAEEMKAITAKMEARGELKIDRTPSAKWAPKGKRNS